MTLFKKVEYNSKINRSRLLIEKISSENQSNTVCY